MQRKLLVRSQMLEFVHAGRGRGAGARMRFRSEAEVARFVRSAAAADPAGQFLRVLLGDIRGPRVAALTEAQVRAEVARLIHRGELAVHAAGLQFRTHPILNETVEDEAEGPETQHEEGSYFYPDIEAEADTFSMEVETEGDAEPEVFEAEAEGDAEPEFYELETDADPEPFLIEPGVLTDPTPSMIVPAVVSEVAPAGLVPAVQAQAPELPLHAPPPDEPSFVGESDVLAGGVGPSLDESPKRWKLRVTVKSLRDFWPTESVSVGVQAVEGGHGREAKYTRMDKVTSVEQVFEGIGKIKWDVSAFATDWEQPRATQLWVAEGDDKAVEVELEPRNWVSFAVVSEAGDAVDNTTIKSKLGGGRAGQHQPGAAAAVLRGLRDEEHCNVEEITHDAGLEFVELTSA